MRASMPQLMVSLARSGDSPESVAAVSLMLELEPSTRHLVFTCNRDGALARTFGSHPNVHVVVLGENTNDESLVMTSSFSNLALAARFLGLTDRPDVYRTICNQAADIAEGLLQSNVDALAQLATAGFTRAVFLGSGCRFGGCTRDALKMLEMSAGRVASVSETYLGLRHGPMSFPRQEHTGGLLPLFRSYATKLRAGFVARTRPEAIGARESDRWRVYSERRA